MGNRTCDAVVIGTGSVGLPAAMSMAERGMKNILCLDQHASPGQGNNKAAIGGIRATHSSPAKIRLCMESIRIFSTWKHMHGFDLEWQEGGYVFVAYEREHALQLKELLVQQKAAGLQIDWHDRDELRKIVPPLNPNGLIGGTFSPHDGSASPLLSSCAFYEHATALGVQFRFNEHVETLIVRHGAVSGVQTDRADYATPLVINAAGDQAALLARTSGITIPIAPDCHEAFITEPVRKFLGPMIVDSSSVAGVKNCYFHQHATGQIIFCFTPDPAITGTDRRETSGFLPVAARRMIDVMPRLATIRVRRVWRGTYPMTPDGSPVIGYANGVSGCIIAAGMCGQGFMLGPGVGALLARMATDTLQDGDKETLKELCPDRSFANAERLT
ncbi:MAG: FAD-binding oxidoreductase [Chitinispirillaceae bacterium]|nr:FAD-binding oxidoreductase [Chitinispirillaceae bacterium]